MQNPNDTFLIIVHTLVGTSFSIVAETLDSVLNLKERIEMQEGVDVSRQHLLLGSRELRDEEDLLQAGLIHGSSITLVLSMKVGPLKTKSLPMDFETLDEEFEYELEEADEEGVQLLGVRIQGKFYFYPAPKCFSYNRQIINHTMLRPPRCNKEKLYENYVTREKVRNLKEQLETKKKKRIKRKPKSIPSSSRISTARPKSFRKSPKISYRRSQAYESAKNNVNLLKAEVFLQAARNKSFGVAPYNFVQLAQYAKSKITVLLEEQREVTGEMYDYIPRPRALLPTVLTKPITTETYSSSSNIDTGRNIDTGKNPAEENKEIQETETDRTRTKRSEGWYFVECAHKDIGTQTSRKKKSIKGKSKLSTARTHPLPTKQIGSSTNLKKRCGQCRKKLSVVNEYECRCGKFFCSKHRYAETHKCTFDYKEEGRRLITEQNPVVTAPKVPNKI